MSPIWSIKMRTYSKNNKSKWAGVMAQVIKPKFKALRSNPSTDKKKKVLLKVI
jgi:hypothetical protein